MPEQGSSLKTAFEGYPEWGEMDLDTTIMYHDISDITDKGG